jgi:hypothetical protein
MLVLDHVIYATRDAAATAAWLRERHGLGAVAGGFHPGQGTSNLVVPLEPPQYLELLEVVDEEAAARSSLGAALMARLARGDGLWSWAVLADDLDAVAARLGIEPFVGHLADAEGNVSGSWRIVAGGDDLPFFIAYDVDPEERRARQRRRHAEAAHAAGASGFAWIEVGGDEERLRDWLGDPTLPVRFAGGPPGPRAVAIRTRDGEIVIR